MMGVDFGSSFLATNCTTFLTLMIVAVVDSVSDLIPVIWVLTERRIILSSVTLTLAAVL
jgi:hypothetical protein